MNIRDMIIEVTRKCNIQCDHCLRGDAVNLNMKKEYIDSLLDQVTGFGGIVFTGGEPSLNVPIMEYFLEECKQRNIPIDYFYIATNGVNVSEQFVIFCLKLYSYCYEKDSCRVDLSNDEFHGYESGYDIELLSGLSFFGKKFEKDDYNYMGGAGLINEGRSAKKRGAHDPIVIDDNMTLEEFENECEVYLNCKGEIINGCNWSYKNQKLHKLCDVGELSTYYEKLQEVEMGVD